MDAMTSIAVGGVSGQRCVGGHLMSEVAVVLNGAGGQMSDVAGVADGVGSGRSVRGLGVHLVDGSSVCVHLVDGRSVHGLDGMDGGCGVRKVSRGGQVSGGSVHGMSVDGGRGLGDDRVEAVHIIGGIVDGTDRTVGLNQRVLSLHDITVAHLVLRLDIAGVAVRDAIVERVLGMRVLRAQVMGC